MRWVRIIEFGLAGLIAGGATFAAFVPGALSAEESYESARSSVSPPALPSISAADFADINVSGATRSVATAVMNRETHAARFTAPAPRRNAPNEAAVSITPRASAVSGPAWSGEALGVQVSYAPAKGPNEPNWWIIGGGGRESFAVSPGGLREFTVAPVSAETTIGDSHLGVAMEVGDQAYASVGYVREVRSFSLGTDDWEEEDHFLGVGFQARW